MLNCFGSFKILGSEMFGPHDHLPVKMIQAILLSFGALTLALFPMMALLIGIKLLLCYTNFSTFQVWLLTALHNMKSAAEICQCTLLRPPPKPDLWSPTVTSLLFLWIGFGIDAHDPNLPQILTSPSYINDKYNIIGLPTALFLCYLIWLWCSVMPDLGSILNGFKNDGGAKEVTST